VARHQPLTLPSGITIRPAISADIAPVLAMIAAVFQEYTMVFIAADEVPDILALETHYTPERGAFFVAVWHDSVVGSVGIDLTKTATAELHRLYLAAAWRGRGIGRALLDTAVGWATDHGAQRIELWSDTRFTLAHNLYTRYGFVQGSQQRTIDDVNATREYFFVLEHGIPHEQQTKGRRI
jgi:putative acetyltransferase